MKDEILVTSKTVQESWCIPPPMPPTSLVQIAARVIWKWEGDWSPRITFSGLQNSGPHRWGQEGKGNSLTLQLPNAWAGQYSWLPVSVNTLRSGKMEMQKYQHTGSQVPVHTYSLFCHWKPPVKVSEVPAALLVYFRLFHSQYWIFSALKLNFFSERYPCAHSSKPPNTSSVLVTFIKQLKIDVLLQNSYWKSLRKGHFTKCNRKNT